MTRKQKKEILLWTAWSPQWRIEFFHPRTLTGLSFLPNKECKEARLSRPTPFAVYSQKRRRGGGGGEIGHLISLSHPSLLRRGVRKTCRTGNENDGIRLESMRKVRRWRKEVCSFFFFWESGILKGTFISCVLQYWFFGWVTFGEQKLIKINGGGGWDEHYLTFNASCFIGYSEWGFFLF